MAALDGWDELALDEACLLIADFLATRLLVEGLLEVDAAGLALQAAKVPNVPNSNVRLMSRFVVI